MNTAPDRVRDIVLRLLEAAEPDLTETSLFKEEHGADSLMIIEIQAGLERELDIVIDNAELSNMVHLRAVREVVERTVADTTESVG
ncbi:acyl carrier protein [Streptomyces sp. UNOB3_S3]|uniref:acyl carrier protein n=1 Tax=Streptomyces sp. UNOB3_S3 TaxID=2871682 RepID=UPI001E5EE4B1|nr:acyl carrier protein [Streptomyces sp. UNOB3_S3]MCC3775145.1 acyl carrier protein [Streptomyces sp. UNOB3_S3]